MEDVKGCCFCGYKELEANLPARVIINYITLYKFESSIVFIGESKKKKKMILRKMK